MAHPTNAQLCPRPDSLRLEVRLLGRESLSDKGVTNLRKWDPTMRAVAVLYLVTLAHHVYGGVVFQSAERLVLALVFTVLFGVTVWLSRLAVMRRRALWGYTSMVVGFWVVLLGFYEGGFNHSLYLILRSAAGNEETLRRLYPAGSDAVISNSVFFQATGVLTLVAAIAVAVTLVVTRQRQPTTAARPADPLREP